MLYGTWQPWIFEAHRIVGFALLALLPWKGVIIYRSLARGYGGSFNRTVTIAASVIFAIVILIVIALSLLWMWRFGPYSVLLQTLIAWHWIIGLAMTPLFLFHLWRRWTNPKMKDVFSRRDALKIAALTGVGILGTLLAGQGATAREGETQPRRFTGSRGAGFFTGNDFPLTGEAAPEIRIEDWRLTVRGKGWQAVELTYGEVLAMVARIQTETLDCTNGWYTIQDWQGVPVTELLGGMGKRGEVRGIRLVSSTGYNHTYPIEEASRILLATHVGGEVLSLNHGFPLRAIVPGRRGWFWVKWITEIVVLDDPAEVAAGVLASPLEVLRQW